MDVFAEAARYLSILMLCISRNGRSTFQAIIKSTPGGGSYKYFDRPVPLGVRDPIPLL